MIGFIIVTIPICYGFIQFLELSALLGRVSGVQQGRALSGYSIQQSIYMLTRLFIIALLPMMGFVVDIGSSRETFIWISHLSLFVATLLGCVSLLLTGRMLTYYGGVIREFDHSGKFLSAFLRPAFSSVEVSRPSLRQIVKSRSAVKTLWQSNIVYLIYTTGMFLSFYAALIFYDYRVTISQMSGVVNAFGAVLLTFVIEPRISRGIDKKYEDTTELIFALFWGRLFATGVSGQVVLAAVFFATK